MSSPCAQAELGYERVKTGPTSNFVGNHMTQGAIDLVQAQLEQPARVALLLGADAGPQPPRLLATSERDVAAAEAATAAAPRSLQQYRWLDDGGSVRVEVPVDQIPLGCSAAGASVTCSIAADRLDLLVCTLPAPAAEEEPSSHGSHSAAPDGSSLPASGTAGPCHRLLLHPLHAAVVPSGCCCYVKGPPALPPGLPGPSQDVAEQPTAAALPQQGSRQATISFALSPGATHIVVELCKADAQQKWPALQASRALSAPVAASGPSAKDQPDVVALRWVADGAAGRMKECSAVIVRISNAGQSLLHCQPLAHCLVSSFPNTGGRCARSCAGQPPHQLKAQQARVDRLV